MSRKEKIIANRDTAQNNFEIALHNTAKSEAAVELYKAYREGVTSLISERAKAGKHLQDIVITYLPELEELTESIIEAQIVLMEDKQNLKESYEILFILAVNVMTVPPQPQPKQKYFLFAGVTEKDGVSSL